MLIIFDNLLFIVIIIQLKFKNHHILKMSSANDAAATKKSKDKLTNRSSKTGSPCKNDSDEPGIVVVSDQGSNQERPFREEL